ncbi:signal transduction protein [Thermotomaculum hydrothermale]|uniref:diguanylate cyclase n=1 Tax=Thermotomaculum hydrothermale TaxID=981385 RepID=A0A7R6SXZ7_9BACT|nr:GGDEF domain-containing protein [Thermotomaculum hydrothermale]BBB32095.1 signal transduction protein [Thermotomaculum hydrothermale]
MSEKEHKEWKTQIIKPGDLKKKTQENITLIPTLVVIAGDLFGQMINLEERKKVFVGRGSECDIVINNPSLSRKHCVVKNENGKIIIEDLGSTNGTFINGNRIKKQELESGERVFLGDICAFKFAYQDDIDLDLNRLILEKAIKDRLTNVYNRTYFDELLRKEFVFHKRANLPLSLVFVDLDDFKKINDTFGHMCGDEILKKVAMSLKSNVRESDYVCRYGGEEFVIILKNTSFEKAMKKAETLRKRIESLELLCNSNSVGVTASFGVSTLEDNNFKSEKRLLAEADSAMYKAKELGKNMVIGQKPSEI